jgi:hypothetical protein
MSIPNHIPFFETFSIVYHISKFSYASKSATFWANFAKTHRPCLPPTKQKTQRVVETLGSMRDDAWISLAWPSADWCLLGWA